MFCLRLYPLLLQMGTETFRLVPIRNILPRKMVAKTAQIGKTDKTGFGPNIMKKVRVWWHGSQGRKTKICRDSRQTDNFHRAKEHEEHTKPSRFSGGQTTTLQSGRAPKTSHVFPEQSENRQIVLCI